MVQVVTVPEIVYIAVVFVGANVPSTMDRNWAMVRVGGGVTLSTAKALFVDIYPTVLELVMVTKYVPAWLVEMFDKVSVGLVPPITMFVTEVLVLGMTFH